MDATDTNGDERQEATVLQEADRPDLEAHTFDVWVCPGCGTMYAELDGCRTNGCENCLDVPEYYGELTTAWKAWEA